MTQRRVCAADYSSAVSPLHDPHASRSPRRLGSEADWVTVRSHRASVHACTNARTVNALRDQMSLSLSVRHGNISRSQKSLPGIRNPPGISPHRPGCFPPRHKRHPSHPQSGSSARRPTRTLKGRPVSLQWECAAQTVRRVPIDGQTTRRATQQRQIPCDAIRAPPCRAGSLRRFRHPTQTQPQQSLA